MPPAYRRRAPLNGVPYKDYFRRTSLGIGMSAIVRRPGDTRRIFGMELTVIEAVAIVAWRPPTTREVTRGLPSTVTASYDSGAPR